MKRYRARWVFPGNAPPLRDAVVSVRSGRIHSVSQTDVSDAHDLGNVALIPGLINAHTHLEFSRLSRPLEPRKNFAGWIRSVIADRQQHSDQLDSAVMQGLAESRQTGTAGLVEIATQNWLFDVSRSELEHPRCLVLREILGLQAERVVDQLIAAERFLQEAREREFTNVGLSPHAPYSLHPQLFWGLCDLAVTRKVPLAMHLAESPAEMQLLERGTGPLVDLLNDMGLWEPGVIEPGTRPLTYLRALSRASRALVVHGTFLNDDEIDFLASQPQMAVVYCPRTHAAMQSGPHPWRTMVDRGVNVVLGTDSRASNPDLSIWEELAFLKSRHPNIPASQLLSLATSNAARALGWTDLGAISPGKIAELAVIDLSGVTSDNAEESLFSGTFQELLR